MCEEINDKPDSQRFGAPNRYCSTKSTLVDMPDDLDFPPLALRRKMKCIKIGATQALLVDEQDKPNMWDSPRPDRYRVHYPNVDVFECPHCHSRIARE